MYGTGMAGIQRTMTSDFKNISDKCKVMKVYTEENNIKTGSMVSIYHSC
jgi:hypothetical protein